MLTKLSGKRTDRLRERKPRRELILDLDSSVSETHGVQEGMRRVGIAPAAWWPRWQWHKGELFPLIGFIVTNLGRVAKRVVRFYNQRGTTEQWIKEGKNDDKWTRLSCRDFVDNQVRLQLLVLAYNTGNFLRQAVVPRAVRHWTLMTLREKLIKIGAKVVRHARQVVFQMAEVVIPGELFRTILEGIGRLSLPTPPPG